MAASSASASSDPAPDRYTALLATDGSPAALEALRAGLAIIRPDARLVFATVTPAPDPSLVTGTGFAGGVMTVEEKEQLLDDEHAAARDVLDEVVAALEVAGETLVLEGRPGPALCDAAGELGAAVIVLGTRGLGGVRRAVLGSVSDHVARNAPCAVLTIGTGG
jgi:nucleotide-binding universal stress UspA family protein